MAVGRGPTNGGKIDTGIDLVARDEDGSYGAIQAKCYSKPKLTAGDVSTFFMNALADDRYGHYMLADTTAGYTSVLEEYILSHPDLDLVHLSASQLETDVAKQNLIKDDLQRVLRQGVQGHR